MKKIIILIMLLTALTLQSYATHNRAGEITYKHLYGYTYRITLITYTYAPSEANEQRNQLELFWGDNTSDWINREEIYLLPGDGQIQKNTYIGDHTFSGPGVYKMIMSDPNRNEDIINIPNSVQVVFTVQTILKIDPDIGSNSTPNLLNPPVDRAALGRRFSHIPLAYDPDGDSLSYKLSVCLGPNGVPIEGYTYPSASEELYVNEITGEFVWDAPTMIGEYNVAMEIEEWRNGIKIGSIIRDMQIEVLETDNEPPIIEPLPDYCITAGNTVIFDVTASDPDGDNIILTGIGGPFEIEYNPAVFTQYTGVSPVTATFTWNTSCIHVRQQPYDVLFRAKDDNPEVQLTGYQETKITVVAQAPENLQASPTSNTIFLSWDTYGCSNAEGFRIYRRKGSYDFTPDECETGLPASADYTLIASHEGASSQSFLDNGTGTGLPPGYEYCYRITAYFVDGAESYVSNEICVELVKGTPVFIEASVAYTDTTNGSIYLKWMQPIEFDTIQFPGPYKYILESSPDLYGQNYSNPIEIIGIEDTIFIDTFINTATAPKSYRLTLYSQDNAEWQQVGTSGYVSSIFIVGHPNDRKVEIDIQDNTPWTNYEYVIYRKDADKECNINNFEYDSIGVSDNNSFTNLGLINETNYWFKIKTTGKYNLEYIPKPLVNLSQEMCIAPLDTIPPCPLSFTVNSDCDIMVNNLSWTVVDSCSRDIANFLIYYSNTYDGKLELIETLDDNSLRTYAHYPETTLAGCYVVSAQDSAGNSIAPEQLTKICIDNCNYYNLPNVFTPDGDGKNDFFIPFPYKFVEKIDIKIYNRWGALVFETDNPDINWDGDDMKSGNPVSDGVYYYLCDVYEYRLSGIEVRNINGFVHIFGNKKNRGSQ